MFIAAYLFDIGGRYVYIPAFLDDSFGIDDKRNHFCGLIAFPQNA